MAQNNELVRSQVVLPIGTLAATTTLPGMKISGSQLLRNGYLIDQAGLAADDTNYYDIALKKGSSTIASYSTKLTGGNGSLVANTPAQLINTATGVAFAAGDAVQLADGDVLTLVVTKHGTGVPTLALAQLVLHGN